MGGKMRRLVCTAAGGHPLATVQWYRGTQEVPSLYTTADNYAAATLDLAVNMTDNGAVYRCVASSKVIPEPMETSVRLNVKFAPAKVTIAVEPGTLRVGETAALSCECGEANPPAALVWLLRGEVIAAGKQIFSRGAHGGKTTRSRLSVHIKSRGDGDVYTCRAYNDLGEALDAVTLAIACTSLLNTPRSLSITKHTTIIPPMNNFSIIHSPTTLLLSKLCRDTPIILIFICRQARVPRRPQPGRDN